MKKAGRFPVASILCHIALIPHPLQDPFLPVFHQIADEILAHFAAVPWSVIIIPVPLRQGWFVLDNGAVRDVIPAPSPVKGCRQAVRGKFNFDGGAVEFGHGESPAEIITCEEEGE